MGSVVMNRLLFYLIEFVVAVVLVLLYYKFIETRGIKKYTKNNIPIDLKLFINLEKVDIKKVNYKTLMRIVAIINAIDVGIVLLMTNLVNSLLLKLVIAVPAIFIVLFMSYNFAGFILKKKGMTKNES